MKQPSAYPYLKIISFIVFIFLILIGIYAFSQKNISETTSIIPTTIPNQTFTITPSPFIILPIDTVIEFKKKSPYLDEPQGNSYRINYDRISTDQILLFTQEEQFFSGVEIIRNNSKVIIKPVFEGFSVPYHNKKPEIKEMNTKLLSTPIYRVKSYFEKNHYTYVDNYNEGPTECAQWTPIPLACHMSGLQINKALD